MEYRQIGATGVTVSALGFGGATLGDVYGAIDAREAHRTVQRALDAGVILFDVSPYYGQTRAETVLGQALAARRAEAAICTKAGRTGSGAVDYSAAAIRRSVEASLTRLRTDHVEILLAHDVEFGDPHVVLGECHEALLACKRDGLCRAIGMSCLPLGVLRRCITSCALDVVLTYCHGTLADDTMLDGLLPLAAAHGVAVINASPLAMGLLADGDPPPWHPAPPEQKEAARRAGEAARALGVSLARTALSWAIRLPGVTATLVGIKSETELAANLEALATPPEPRAVAAAREALAPVRNHTWPAGIERPEARALAARWESAWASA